MGKSKIKKAVIIIAVIVGIYMIGQLFMYFRYGINMKYKFGRDIKKSFGSDCTIKFYDFSKSRHGDRYRTWKLTYTDKNGIDHTVGLTGENYGWNDSLTKRYEYDYNNASTTFRLAIESIVNNELFEKFFPEYETYNRNKLEGVLNDGQNSILDHRYVGDGDYITVYSAFVDVIRSGGAELKTNKDFIKGKEGLKIKDTDLAAFLAEDMYYTSITINLDHVGEDKLDKYWDESVKIIDSIVAAYPDIKNANIKVCTPEKEYGRYFYRGKECNADLSSPDNPYSFNKLEEELRKEYGYE